ncbi:hypothetical protein EES43_07960 [Streptomyces sp. ADI96-02]|uniref:hypothetical protein n=1 Tax=unclassified Streptomyces TaxID=2593676 RepID=UPI000F557009|nr:hypothetical protein [Streptomyces sp. ADI96-02]RPK65649.1 hypothetical protein EES43_07960 [Streptomyces sp. ADI96-02]
MPSLVTRLSITSARICGIAALSAAALALSAPLSDAAHEARWTDGCRGYWYTTAGHAYCTKSTAGVNGYDVEYDCRAEIDQWNWKVLKYGYKGKFDRHECTIRINKTRVTS